MNETIKKAIAGDTDAMCNLGPCFYNEKTDFASDFLQSTSRVGTLSSKGLNCTVNSLIIYCREDTI